MKLAKYCYFDKNVKSFLQFFKKFIQKFKKILFFIFIFKLKNELQFKSKLTKKNLKV